MEGIWFPVFWSFSGGVLPSHHPMYENLGDQQAEDARTKWQTLAANLKQDV